jgi:zinc ribbon protein
LPYCPSCGKEAQADASFCPNCGQNLKQTVPPPPPPYSSASSGLEPDASTARTLTLVAIVLQLVFFLGGLLIVSAFLLAVASVVGGSIAFGFIGAILGTVFSVSILWIVLDYFLVYRNLESRDRFERARSWALVLGILQLVIGGVLPGIFLIIAWLKIDEAVRRTGEKAHQYY